MGAQIVGAVIFLIKVVIGLTIVLVILAAVPSGAFGEFANGVLRGVGGAVSQLPEILNDARGGQTP